MTDPTSLSAPVRSDVPSLRALVSKVQAALEYMDRAGADSYAMPECSWCHAQGSSEGDDNYHSGDCELVAAREALAALDQLLTHPPVPEKD